MSDTPRTDAESVNDGNEVSGYSEVVESDFARQLERELNEAKHRIRTLIEERDSARIQAGHKWRLREEFEALLGTADVEIGVERVKEAQKGAARYEYVRKLTTPQYSTLLWDCVEFDLKFDEEVDRRRSAK